MTMGKILTVKPLGTGNNCLFFAKLIEGNYEIENWQMTQNINKMLYLDDIIVFVYESDQSILRSDITLKNAGGWINEEISNFD